MSDQSSHDSSLDTMDSPSIDNHNNDNAVLAAISKHALKQETNASANPYTHTIANTIHHNHSHNHNSHSLLFTPNSMNNDDLLFQATNDIHSNPMDFLMMDLTQHTSANGTINLNMSSPVLDFQSHLNGNLNITPSLNALTHGLFELNHSNPNTPHLPPLNIAANSQHNPSNSNTNTNPTTATIDLSAVPLMPSLPCMPIVNPIGDNIPPPTNDLDWQTFCTLINTPNRKRKKLNPLNIAIDGADNLLNCNSKKRKLNSSKVQTPKQIKQVKQSNKKKRGRPRKNAEKISVKKEKKVKRKYAKKQKKRKGRRSDEDEEYSMDDYMLMSDNGAESYVGIRTCDGEVRIQIPPNPKSENPNYSTVKFSVFGNACSDKIEDILQPKKRTRYVRGLSEEEKKTRRREQNRNAAARSRARKNAMISKVIQLHQENMGLRAFVAENITQTKILRDEINRLNALIMLQQTQTQTQPQTQALPPNTAQSSLFDIINQDSSTLFQNK